MLENYQLLTRETDLLYGRTSFTMMQNLTYYLKGICSETGELLTATDYENKMKECGDICWYIARFCDEWNGPTFKQVWEDTIAVSYPTIASMFVIGQSKIADVLKKWERDGYASTAEEMDKRRVLMEYGLTAILSSAFSYIKYEVQEAGMEYTDRELIDLILAKNIDKLSSRKQKQTLRGSGDER